MGRVGRFSVPATTCNRPLATEMAKNFNILKEQVMARPGAKEHQAKLRQETLAEYGLYQLRSDSGVTQIQLAERLGITQRAVSKIEHAEDMRISTLRSYLESLGSVLHLEAELPLRRTDTAAL
jgi:DNA-binding XRE family transcriptional regulator